MPADAVAMPAPGFLAFLREELAPRPGRTAAVARISVSTSLVVAIAMLYQIPLPAYMAYAVFVISQKEAASTLLTGLVASLAFTIAIALSLLFYTLDAAEPALRLPLMALSTFIGMFLVRTMTLGPVAFLAAFVLVLSQTLIDRLPSLEALTRLVLWLWVVVAVPTAVTVLVNLLFGENPARLARRTGLALFRALSDALTTGDTAPLQPLRETTIALVELRHRAEMFDRRLRDRASADGALIETLAEFVMLLQGLPADTPAEVRLPFAEACRECARAFARNEAPQLPLPGPTDAMLRALSGTQRPTVMAIGTLVTRLGDGIAGRRSKTAASAPAPAKSLLSPDAFSNPDHARFALKTTLAVMAAYIIYSLLDWTGISTAITTCFFVALGTLGETIHKLTLRLTGALLGGLAGGLAIVYLLPELTDIGQLCLLIAAVSAACAWVATASELLSYAGMQIAFAFFLGVLQDYGPATDLTVLRDRVAGILLGNVLMSVVFSTLWSTSAADRAWAAGAKALRTLGGLLIAGGAAPAAPRLAAIRALEDARRFAALAAFELRLLPDGARGDALPGVSLSSLERLAAAVFVVVDQDPAVEPVPAAVRYDATASAWLMAWADHLTAGRTSGGPPLPPAPRFVAGIAEDVPGFVRASIEARAFLETEIDNAVAVGT